MKKDKNKSRATKEKKVLSDKKNIKMATESTVEPFSFEQQLYNSYNSGETNARDYFNETTFM